MQKIKICYLVEELNRGGMENIIASIATGLNKEKYDVAVWCIVSGGEIAQEIEQAGIKVKILNMRTYHNPFNILKLASIFREEKFNILHTHGYFASTMGRIAALLAGVPFLISHIHTIFYNLNARNVWIDRFLNRFTHKIVFISQAVKDSFEKVGYSFSSKAVLIHNAVADIALGEHQWDQEKKIIINVASLYPHKGQIYLLQAMAEIVQIFPQVCLWIAGEGSLKDELENKIKVLKLEGHVLLLGKRKDIPQLLSQAHIFVLPSLREGFPLSIIEAMAFGLPVVASRVGGIMEMITDQNNGILCPAADSKALASGIIALLNDTPKCCQMGKASRKLFEEKFTKNQMLQKLDHLYQKARIH